MQKMADGQATKIIFPFELTNLVKQGAKFLGGEDLAEVDEIPDITLDESILGDLPNKEEIAKAVESVKNASELAKTPEDITD
jgi:hypothetical protein